MAENNLPTMHPTVLIAADKLNPAPYNPRRIKTAMLESLKASIRQYGFLDPLVIRKTGRVVIGGHQRLKALKELCLEAGQRPPKVPCIVLDVDDRRARELNVSLNRLGGEFDNKLLAELLSGLNAEATLSPEEIALMGYSKEDVDKLLAVNEPPRVDPDDLTDFARSVTLSLAFADVKRRDAVKALLKQRADTLGKPSGEVVYDLLGGK